MANIEIKDLSFSYGDKVIFEKAQINIDEKWKLGLVGRNGRGKTTLLKILQRQVEAEISVKSSRRFIYFPQEVKDASKLTFAVLSELVNFEQWKIERELTLLKVDLAVLWRPFDSLSGGEQTKCLLALLFLDETNFPLIDEPTNHLDLPSRQLAANYLRTKTGFILVSHDRDFLDKVTNHTLAIERQQITLYQGNFSVYEEEKRRRDDFELEEDSRLRKDISRLKQTALERRDWASQRENVPGATFFDKKVAKKQNQRAKSIEKHMVHEISDKEKLLKNIEKIDPLAMRYQPDYRQILVTVKELTLSYHEEQALFKPLSFELTQGKIIALVGENGIGKSSIIERLCGNFTGQTSGEVRISPSLQLSTVRQITAYQGSLKDFAINQRLNYELFLSHLRKFGMERRTFQQTIETMSQGEQKKIELAKSLSQPAQLYLWDEPLNYLDVFNQEQIIALLTKVKPAMLIIEHDLSFIRAVADQVIEIIT